MTETIRGHLAHFLSLSWSSPIFFMVTESGVGNYFYIGLREKHIMEGKTNRLN